MSIQRSASNALRSATTRVDIASATAPSSGQVLTATSSTAATWQSPSAPSSTSGTSAGPVTSASTQTITHGLGRTPVVIRLEGVGRGANSTSGVTTPRSTGVYDSSGNHCVVSVAGVGQQLPGNNDTKAIYLSDESITTSVYGTVQNVTSTTFDIVWGAFGTSLANTVFLWNCQ